MREERREKEHDMLLVKCRTFIWKEAKILFQAFYFFVQVHFVKLKFIKLIKLEN